MIRAGLRHKSGLPLDSVRLSGLRVDCIVGVYPQERTTAQPLEVDLALYLDTRGVREGELGDTVDYARLAAELRFLLEVCQFRLLEIAAQALCCYVLAPPIYSAPHARVRAACVELRKPQALGGTLTPSLKLFRRAGEPRYAREEKDFGHVDILFETRDCGIYRLAVAPGRSIASHHHCQMQESEMVLSSGLLLQHQPVRAGSVLHWPAGLVHRYDNPGPSEQTILCVDRPRFIPADEIPDEPTGDGEPATLQMIEHVSYYPEAAQGLREGRS